MLPCFFASAPTRLGALTARKLSGGSCAAGTERRAAVRGPCCVAFRCGNKVAGRHSGHQVVHGCMLMNNYQLDFVKN